jgi:hypothetical protein
MSGMKILTILLALIGGIGLGAFAEAAFLTAKYGGDLIQQVRFAVLDVLICAFFSGLWLACWALVFSRTTLSAMWILAALAAWISVLWFWFSGLFEDRPAVLVGFGACVSTALLVALRFRALSRSGRE